MITADRRKLFEHYCETQTSFHQTPSLTDFSAGYDAGVAHMHSELDALKRQILSMKYGHKSADGTEGRIATLEALNKALIHALSEINAGNEG
jgi:hypothetical protein